MKRKELPDSDSVDGYVLDVSPVKTASSGIRYFDGKFQTKHDVMRFVSFSPDKKDPLTTAKNMKSPIKLTQIQINPKHGTNEIKLSKHSSVQVMRQLSFTCTELPPEATPIAQDVTIDQITEEDKLVNIKAMVLDLGEIQQIRTKYGIKPMQPTLLADSTGAIALPLWSMKIGLLEANKSYHLTNLLTKSFKEELQLGTTAATTAEIIPDVQYQPEQKPVAKPLKTITGEVLVSSTMTSFKCLQCCKLLKTSEEDCANEQVKIKCEECGARQKLTHATKARITKIQIQDESKQILMKLTAGTDCLNNFVEAYQLKKTDIELDDFLLDHPITVAYKDGTDFVTEIKKA